MNSETTQTAAPVDRFVIQPFYDQGGITIYNADCRKVLPWLGRFDLLLTDPPYGIGADKNLRANKQHGRAVAPSKDYGSGAWDDAPPPRWFLDAAQEQADHAILWGGNYYGLPAGPCWLVWDKDTLTVS